MNNSEEEKSMKKHFKLLSFVLAALTFMSASSVTFAASQNSKPSTCKKILKYGLTGAGVTATAILVAIGAYKIFGPKANKNEVESESETGDEVEIEINCEEDFEQIQYCRNNLIKATVNVENIPKNAFENCKKLKEVDLAGVKSIGRLAFCNCKKLEILRNSSTVEIVHTMTFFKCSALKIVDLPGVKMASECMFFECPSLEKINLPNVKTVEVLYALGKWQNFTEADSYRSSIIYKCPSLKEVNLPENISPVPCE